MGLSRRLSIDPAERKLGGRVSAILWIIGGLTLLLYPSLPGVPRQHLVWEVALAAAAVAWGLLSLVLLDWKQVHPLVIQLSTCSGLAAIGGAVWATGGSSSPAWIYLFFVTLFAAYFYDRAVGVAYIAAGIVIQAAPLLYDTRVLHDGFLAQLLTAGAGYLAVGGAIMAGKALLDRLRRRAEWLAAEQSSLRRVATAVVGNEPVEDVYALAAREVGAVVGAGTTAITQITSEGARVLGTWADGGFRRLEADTHVPIAPDSDFERALLENRPVRAEDLPREHFARALGCTAVIIVPVSVRGILWGALLAGAAPGVPGDARLTGFEEADEQALSAFSELLASAVTNVEDRVRLSAQALRDPLTGLANQRALHQRLAGEVAGAMRHGRALSIAMLDVDNFKEINDTGGHDAGDAALRELARCLASVARAEDTLGRAGGDEFMWILPDTTSDQALVAVERARGLIADSITRPVRITTSAGICDTRTTSDPSELARLADVALYVSKARGRDRATLYEAEIARDLSSDTADEQADRAEALHGLRALARAIDAKDPATREHSERVSRLTAMLAEAAGWPPERIALLREAALLHDVGKIGVSDALLRKPARLTQQEWDEMTAHADLSARIVGSVLTDEQVRWIHLHHERPDGRGYPFGLRDGQIPDGAALIAVADAWDVMSVGRPYRARRSVEEAIAECRSLAGRQFTHEAVDALLALERSGKLDGHGRSTDPKSGSVASAQAWTR